MLQASEDWIDVVDELTQLSVVCLQIMEFSDLCEHARIGHVLLVDDDSNEVHYDNYYTEP